MKSCSVTQRREVKLIFSANSIQWKPGRERTRAQVGVGTSARRGRASGSGVRFGGCKINKLASGFLFVFPPPHHCTLWHSLCVLFFYEGNYHDRSVSCHQSVTPFRGGRPPGRAEMKSGEEKKQQQHLNVFHFLPANAFPSLFTPARRTRALEKPQPLSRGTLPSSPLTH